LEIFFLLQTSLILLACIQTFFWKFFKLQRHVILWTCILDFFFLFLKIYNCASLHSNSWSLHMIKPLVPLYLR
jgi:hypothetical protein